MAGELAAYPGNLLVGLLERIVGNGKDDALVDSRFPVAAQDLFRIGNRGPRVRQRRSVSGVRMAIDHRRAPRRLRRCAGQRGYHYAAALRKKIAP